MGLQGRNYSYWRCPPLRLATPTIRDPRESACQELRKDFFETLERDPNEIPDIIIVHARWPLLLQRERFNNREGGVEAGDAWIWELPVAGDDYGANMGAEIRQSIQSILDAGKVVVLIYPVPEMGWDVPKKLMRHLLIEPQIPDHLASIAYNVYLDRTRTAFAALDSIADHDRLIRIRPDQSLCNHALENRCIAHLDGDPLYFDDDHLSNRGARLVLQEVVSRLAALTNAPPDSRGASRH